MKFAERLSKIVAQFTSFPKEKKCPISFSKSSHGKQRPKYDIQDFFLQCHTMLMMPGKHSGKIVTIVHSERVCIYLKHDKKLIGATVLKKNKFLEDALWRNSKTSVSFPFSTNRTEKNSTET